MKNKTVSKTDVMITESIPALVFKYSLTTLAALLFSALYNTVDALFVSRGVGDNAIGGVSVVFPFMIIQAAIAQTVGGGAASVVSRKLGNGDKKGAGEATLCAMALFYISALTVTAAGLIFMKPILSLLGVTKELAPYATEYFRIILLGNVFSTGFSSIIRAEGRMGYSLMIWLIPTAVNIVLDAVFIFSLNMGVKGVAAATVLGQFTSFSMSVLFFARFSSQNFHGAKPNIKTVKEIIGIGIPTLVQSGSLSVIALTVNNILSRNGGTFGVNTFAYMSKIITFGIVPVNAVALASSPVIGYNYGAKNKLRVKNTVSFSLAVCAAYSIIAVITAYFASPGLIGIFTSDKSLINAGANGLRIVSFALPFAAITLILGVYFQAIGKKLPALILNAAILVYIIPFALIFSKLWQITGVWLAFIPACTSAALTALIIYAKSGKVNV